MHTTVKVHVWQDPPVHAIVTRDEHRIHFRCAEPPMPNPEKYDDELLDAYLFIDDADGLYAEYAARCWRIQASACEHAVALAGIRREGL